MAKLVNANAVIIAQSLNPSIFTQLWLVRQQVFEENDFKEECLFSPTAVNAKGESKELLIVPERLQLTLTPPENKSEIVKDVIGKIVTALPHTPYKAVGFNFNWLSSTSSKATFPAMTRRMFASDTNPLVQFFQSEDARFGVYMSKNVDGSRLRLEVKPLVGDTALRFDFNFHLDLTEGKAIEMITQMLNDWSRMESESEMMVREAEKGWS